MQENGRESFEKVDFAAKLKENRRKTLYKEEEQKQTKPVSRYSGIPESRQGGHSGNAIAERNNGDS